MNNNYDYYKDVIAKFEMKDKYEKNELLINELLIKKQDNIEIYYAPHNEYVNKRAKIVIVGLCPGWTQTEISIRTAIRECHNNSSVEDILYDCKIAARFAGSMRKNLIKMLDEISLNKQFSLSSCSELFSKEIDILHTTSLIPFPVFINSKNYNGYTPSISNDLFKELINKYFVNEIKQFDNVIVVPLGNVVEKELDKIIKEYHMSNIQVLRGLPHPSGANVNRKKLFEEKKDYLRMQVDTYGEWL